MAMRLETLQKDDQRMDEKDWNGLRNARAAAFPSLAYPASNIAATLKVKIICGLPLHHAVRKCALIEVEVYARSK